MTDNLITLLKDAINEKKKVTKNYKKITYPQFYI